MLVNTLAQSSLSSAETCCDLFVGQHRALRLCFNLSAFRTMESKFVKPKVFELPPLPHDVNAKRTQLAHEVDLAQGLLDAGPKEGDSFSSVGSCGVDSTIWLQHSWLVCAAWVLVLHLTWKAVCLVLSVGFVWPRCRMVWQSLAGCVGLLAFWLLPKPIFPCHCLPYSLGHFCVLGDVLILGLGVTFLANFRVLILAHLVGMWFSMMCRLLWTVSTWNFVSFVIPHGVLGCGDHRSMLPSGFILTVLALRNWIGMMLLCIPLCLTRGSLFFLVQAPPFMLLPESTPEKLMKLSCLFPCLRWLWWICAVNLIFVLLVCRVALMGGPSLNRVVCLIASWELFLQCLREASSSTTSWPAAVTAVVTVLLPKPEGGHRPTWWLLFTYGTCK